MKYVALLLILASFASFQVLSAERVERLPIGFTEEELTRLDEIGINTVPTAPPPSGTVNPGEFDPSTGVMVSWDGGFGLPADLVVAISEETKVWVICTSGQQSTVESTLQSWGVTMSNVDYIFTTINSIWIRDYGPWFLLMEDGTQGIFNYTYNRPRPDDNNFPVALGSDWGIPVYTSTIEHTGGNYMSSGYGQSMSTAMVYDENGGDEDWVDSQMQIYLGVDNYVTMDDPQGSYIDHIDCWAKMLSPGKLMVLRVPPSHDDYVALEAAADLLAATESPYGSDWDVYRVDCGGTEGYTNSLINEDHVYLPLFGTSYDSGAISVYQTAMPGYTIEGFEYYDWQSTDALHCRTRNVMDNEMLFLRHVPVDPQQTANDPVTVDVLIRNHPNNALTSSQVHYRVGTSGSFTSLDMTETVSDSFTADIPGVAASETVQYYISASDDSGRDEELPRFAPDTWFFQYETTGTGIGGQSASQVGLMIEHAEPNPFDEAVS
ncbi:MAG: hypothetical protein GF388_03910, partial [Candidatus Aegiribacteria sp.]|nr:hypothetical protein [Candidatus Aegiribacteria sp.]MBD3294399.1 hypothetical protein [Candidatus Fermentibacteria bacterium]